MLCLNHYRDLIWKNKDDLFYLYFSYSGVILLTFYVPDDELLIQNRSYFKSIIILPAKLFIYIFTYFHKQFTCLFIYELIVYRSSLFVQVFLFFRFVLQRA
jgi:hypothetical protein